MAIYRGPGGAGDATTDSSTEAAAALAAAAAAASSATSAANSATSASSSATSATNSKNAAATSATNAATSATSAASSATSATASKNAAATSATNAANSATAAATSATAAATSATNAANASRLTVGTTTTGSPGTNASVVIAGAAGSQTVSFTIPRGDVGSAGATGATGAAGPANTLSIGTVSSGSSPSATITGTSPSQTLNLVLPKGDKGDTGDVGSTGATGAAGPANTLNIGTVTTGAAGSSASATITGIAPNQTLSLTLPKGDTGSAGNDGAAATINVGTVTTGAAGSSVSITNSGTSSAAVLNFTIPKGDTGSSGNDGVDGDPGLVWKGTYASGTAYVEKDAVSYNGSSYICILASTGNVPTNTTYWNLLASKGLDGGGGGSGTVTSVDISVPTGLSVSGTPITTSGTAAITYASGYSIPTTTKQGQWDTAYGWGNHALAGYANEGVNTDITSMSGITGGITTPDYVTFDTTPETVPTAAGSLYWDSADGNQTLSLIMAGGDVVQQIGQEQYYRIKASSAITNGQVVMFTGSVGASGALTGAPATGLTAATASYVMGIATQDIANNGWGYVTSFGLVRDLNTSAFTDGAILYLDPTVAGGLTTTVPTAPAPKVQICAVTHAATNGSLFVRLSFGGVLGQYEGDVNISSASSGQVLKYNGTTWVNTAETDPVFVASPAYNITNTNITNWNTAYGWGNHASAGYLTSSAIGSTVQAYDADLTSWASKTAPTGDAVGTTDSQTLTNKTFTGYTETVYNLTGTEINSTNGTLQYKTLSGNTTFTEAVANGQSVTLLLNPSTYTVTWPTTTWVGSVASTAPTLVASVYNCITFFQIDGVFYGKYEGRV